VFRLLAATGIKVRSEYDVPLFIMGMAVFWVLIEKVILSAILRTKMKRPRPPNSG
jgi:hypothetical protein